MEFRSAFGSRPAPLFGPVRCGDHCLPTRTNIFLRVCFISYRSLRYREGHETEDKHRECNDRQIETDEAKNITRLYAYDSTVGGLVNSPKMPSPISFREGET